MTKATSVALAVGAAIAFVAVAVFAFRVRSTEGSNAESPPALASAPSRAVAVEEVRFDVATAASILEPMFDTLDCGQAGFVQEPEIDEHFSQVFRYHDRDLSRTITLAEYRHGAQGARKKRLDALYARIDADGSGIVSSKEYRDHLHTLFRLADVNSDGDVTRDELRAQRPR